MRIRSMTATFGKLEHEKLNLEPGLNILQAPNEWGKSTWCAFLTAMLYGLDTRAKSTRSALADKEHYAPWSGSPMAGRMEISWKGREITIERTTKGRIPMGEFKAYETGTGLEIPELNAANCGQQLLGVEKSVFLRSGFIRLSDLPVTEDEALRRRLNALVTTGDESGRDDRLAGALKELKNRIRYNRSGLLPQAEAEKESLQDTLRELELLREQAETNRERLDSVADWQLLLENHMTALAYAAAREDAQHVKQARHVCDDAENQLRQAQALCDLYPDRETAEQVIAEIDRLDREQRELEREAALLPEPEEYRQIPDFFAGLSPEEMICKAKADRDSYIRLSDKYRSMLLFALLLAAIGGGMALWNLVPGLLCAGLGGSLLVLAVILRLVCKKRMETLAQAYGNADPGHWVREADALAGRIHRRREENEALLRRKEELQTQLVALQENIAEATEGRGLASCREDWREALAAWDSLDRAKKQWQQAQDHYRAVQAMAKTVSAPEFPDRMAYSREETEALLSQCVSERQHLENRLGQLQGRMEAIGEPAVLRRKLDSVTDRITRLEKTYQALVIAQETLTEASQELQRRFAPRISQRAQVLMDRLTGGEYERLRLSDDLTLRAGTRQEDTLREILWRSDGTVDQLYLALRLAVAGELTPEAPLILDDALVRFDDTRLKVALEILWEEAEEKQVLLFTCHSREKKML